MEEILFELNFNHYEHFK